MRFLEGATWGGFEVALIQKANSKNQ